jgi:hypothetical protein
LLLLHAFRHVGLVLLVPTVVGAVLPASFAVPTAYGDLLTGLLALVAIGALRGRWRAAIGLVWMANLVGSVDLLYGFSQGIRFRVALGAAYYIPIVVNPAMYVTHAMIFAILVKRSHRGGLEGSPFSDLPRVGRTTVDGWALTRCKPFSRGLALGGCGRLSRHLAGGRGGSAALDHPRPTGYARGQ